MSEPHAPAPQIDTGDTVAHAPTGEHWVVGYVDGDRLTWVGWPEGEASVSDCTLIETAKEETRRAMLYAMTVGYGRRAQYARARLAAHARLAAFGAAVLRAWHGNRCVGELDEGALQDMALTTGVCVEETRTVPCGEVCACADTPSAGEEVSCVPIRPDVFAAMQRGSGL